MTCLWKRGGGVVTALLLGILVLSGALLNGCSEDKKKTTGPDDDGDEIDGFVVTEEMAGIWQMNLTLRDCINNNVLLTDSVGDTLCVGEDLIAGTLGGSADDCTVTQNGNTFRIVCELTAVNEGCTTSTNIDITVNLSGSSFTSDGTLNVADNPGGCSGSPFSCVRINLSGNRTGPVPPGACPPG